MTERPLKSRAALEVILFEERRFVGSLMFTTPDVTIGSDPGAMVRLADPEVAPCHAVLRFDGVCCRIDDCGSELGTAVNGQPVASQAVEGMDEISIGRHRLRITLHRADANPAPGSPRPLPSPSRKSPLFPSRQPAPPSPPSQAHAPAPSVPGVRPSKGTSPFGTPSLSPRPSSTPAASAPRDTASGLAASAPRPSVPFGAAPRPASPARTAAPTALVGPPSAAPSFAATAFAPDPDDDVEELPTGKLFVVADEEPLQSRPLPAHAVPDHDDDDEDAPFEPAFSLLDGLCEVGLAGAAAEYKVEVIRFRHGCVTKLRHLRSGERLRLPGLRKPVGRSSRSGEFSFFGDVLPTNAAISQAGQPIDDVLWRQRANQDGRVPLDPGTQVCFPLSSGEGVLVHMVPSATPVPRAPLGLKLSKRMLWIAGLSLLLHLVVFALIGLTSLVRREYITDAKKGRFARIALKEIELEPPPAPTAREKKKTKPEPSEHAPNEIAPRVSVTHIPRARTTAPPPQASATAQKLLSALGGLSATPKTSMATAMSNLDAVAPVRGGGFKVSGAIGKLPGDSLRLAAAGSGIGRLDTKSTNDVAKDLGRVLGRGPTGQVRAQVTTKPNAMKVEGQLDRGEIQRVINSHIHELQGCYERQLIVSPNLSGKVSFEWVIGTNGAVTSVKIKTSTLSSNEATSCMQAAIRRWQFPAPSGGSVTVIYPIALANGT